MNEVVRGGGPGLAYAGGGPIPKLRSSRGESSVIIRPFPFASVVVAAGLALAAFAGITRDGGGDGPEPSTSTSVVDASNDSRFRSL